MKNLVVLCLILLIAGCGQFEVEVENSQVLENANLIEDINVDNIKGSEDVTLEVFKDDDIYNEVLVYDYDRFANNTDKVFGVDGVACREDEILYDFGLEPKDDEGVIFEDFDKGISFYVPYNSEWGRGQYYVEPFQVKEDKVAFGPLVYPGGPCFQVGNIELSFLDPIDYDKFMDRSIDYIGTDLDDQEVIVDRKDILGMDVLRINLSSFCDSSAYVVFGEKHNYLFEGPGCHGGYLNEEFVGTIELL